MSRQFIQWFVGFTDAEGNFSIVPRKGWMSVSFRFTIEVHKDDLPVLQKISETLGIGNIIVNKDSASFVVNKFKDLLDIIIPIFQEFPLQTSKYLDFTCFYEAILIKLKVEKHLLKKDMGLLKQKKLKESMNSKRLVISEIEKEDLKKKISINKWWLLGFVEGEGTFGYKHLIPYFQIAQHKKNLFVLEAIEKYLLDFFNENLNIKPNNLDFKFIYTLNKLTGVYSITIVKVDLNFFFIVPFFEPLSFLSRKKLDYIYWVLTVIIHKLGYYYTPLGKKLTLHISLSTNKQRYTNKNKIELPDLESIIKLLDQKPVFDDLHKSHFEQVRDLTIAKGGRKGFTVYIYEYKSDGINEIKGSPFSTYGDGHEKLGLIRGSRVIGRYIDTEKKYKNKYLFSSISLD